MGNVDRARQFMPFDALKGLQEALREKEKEIEDKKELSEESYSQIDRILRKLNAEDDVNIKFYKDKKYIEVYGKVTKINKLNQMLIINNHTNIYFDDIIKIEII
ncbi:MAG: YolD-like family protein [Clostridiales bacterium]|nr:YolD-like family protein [Clostridiales bacterium]